LIVASVPHSGSRFVSELLRVPFWHVYQGESLERIFEHEVIVVPLRHPLAVAQSWKNRGKPIVSHPKHEPMVAMWRTLIDVIAPRKPFYVPVDSDQREVYLAKLGKALRRRLKTDWKFKSDGYLMTPLNDEDEAAVKSLLADPFFEQFYPTRRV
jgi:hypothetical protein